MANHSKDVAEEQEKKADIKLNIIKDYKSWHAPILIYSYCMWICCTCNLCHMNRYIFILSLRIKFLLCMLALSLQIVCLCCINGPSFMKTFIRDSINWHKGLVSRSLKGEW